MIFGRRNGAMRESLESIERSLAELHRDELLRRLRPGLDSNATREALAGAGLGASPHLVELYEWHDGTDVTTAAALGDVYLLPGFYILSLADALDLRAALLPGGRWKEQWLPVLANGGGDFYLLDGSRRGVIRHYWFDELDDPIEYNSLADLMSTIAAAFERGLFFVDEHGFLEMDDAAFTDFAATRNPSAPGWR